MKKAPAGILLFLLFVGGSVLADTRVVRVGAFNYYPAIFKDSDGQIKGFYVDALRELGKQEDIRFEYVWGSWNDGLERIKAGEVDLLTSVAFTDERSAYMDYCKTPLLTVWSELYVLNKSEIDGIDDLHDARIAVMAGDYNAVHFLNLIEKFRISITLTEHPSFDAVYEAVASGQADGGIVNCTFGVAKQHEYGLRSTGLVFNPFDIFFTVAKGKNGDLLEILDRYLIEWKHEPNSAYNTARQNWSHGSLNTIEVIPDWMTMSIAVLVCLLVVFFLFTILLRFRVARATRTIRERERLLRESEARLRSYFEHSPDGVFVVDNDGKYLDVNPAAVAITGYSAEELKSMSIPDLQSPETVNEDMQNFYDLQETGRISNEFTFRHKNGEIRWWAINGVKLSETRSLGFARDITARRVDELKIQSLLAEKTALLKEVHQRIKNNMITIKGLLYLQAEALQDTKITEVLNEAENRVQSMIILYDKLFSSENYRELSVREYLEALATELIAVHPNRKKVRLDFKLHDFILNVRFLVPLGIMVNELISNSLKFAFNQSETGTIGISGDLDGSSVTIIIEDDGAGLPDDKILESSNGVGLNLVYMLIRQIDGSYEIDRAKGTRFTIRFDIS